MSAQDPKTAGEYAIPLIERIVDEAPERAPGSRDERRAQEILREEFEELGLETELHGFSFNRSIYANFALHFGLATLAALFHFVVPFSSAIVLALVAVSYLGDSTRRFYLLRRLLPSHESRNLLARVPASTEEPRERLVVVAHADAAYTGEIFEPDRLRASTELPDLPFDLATKPLRLATICVALLAAIGFAASLFGVSIWSGLATVLLAVPPALVAAANLEIVYRNEIVPGANDNLTGCAGAVMLADRLAGDVPDDVELFFVVTGAEEAGGGGAHALARDRLEAWDWIPDETTVVGIDGLSNGEIRYFREAEVVRFEVAPHLRQALAETRESDEAFAELDVHEIPAGSTDVLSFLALGYQGVCIGCVDPEFGAPRHYHHPTDTPDNLDASQIDRSVDLTEAFLRRLAD